MVQHSMLRRVTSRIIRHVMMEGDDVPAGVDLKDWLDACAKQVDYHDNQFPRWGLWTGAATAVIAVTPHTPVKNVGSGRHSIREGWRTGFGRRFRNSANRYRGNWTLHPHRNSIRHAYNGYLG